MIRNKSSSVTIDRIKPAYRIVEVEHQLNASPSHTSDQLIHNSKSSSLTNQQKSREEAPSRNKKVTFASIPTQPRTTRSGRLIKLPLKHP